MKKKKVLFVINHLTIGGGQRSLISALNALDYERYDVTLYLRKDRQTLVPEVNSNVNVVVNKDSTHYYMKLCSLWLMFLALFKSKKAKEKLDAYVCESRMKNESKRYFSNADYDIAIAYMHGYPAEFVAEYVNAEKKIVFYHVSTDELHDVNNAAFEKFDLIVGVNENIRKELFTYYPKHKDKITYLNNYVDYKEILQKSKETVVEALKGKTVLCTCGRFAPVKGFDIAVEAARLLKDNGENFVWYFVGDGPERAALEKKIDEYKLSDCIVMTGMQKNPYPYINACDIYIMPSREESYGLAAAEAQILCKPVVTTATVGGKYIVDDGKTGLVADINAYSLAQSTAKLMHSPKLYSAMTNSLKNIDYSYDFERYKSDWKKLLEGNI